MLRKTLIRRQHVHPETGRYSQATFHDGAHRQAPGDSTPWRDTSNPLLKLRTWWMAPAAKGSIVAAWSCTAVVFSYCWSLQIDAKGTYTMNNVLLRNLHQEAVRADASEERARSMQVLLAEAQAAAADAQKKVGEVQGQPVEANKKPWWTFGLGGGSGAKDGNSHTTKSLAADPTDNKIKVPEAMDPLPPAVVPKSVLDSSNSMINYELELTRERVRSAQVHERNQNLVAEMNKLRSELFLLRKENKDLAAYAERIKRASE